MPTRRTEQVFLAIDRLRLKHKIILGDDGSPYLLRTHLTPDRDWWRKELEMKAAFLHFFFRSDADRELHNHPWDGAYSLILSGGYWEERWDPRTRTVVRKLFKPGMINRLSSDTFHRVQLVDEDAGCWTLFVAGRKVLADGEWGFMLPDGSGFETANARYERMSSAHQEAS